MNLNFGWATIVSIFILIVSWVLFHKTDEKPFIEKFKGTKTTKIISSISMVFVFISFVTSIVFFSLWIEKKLMIHDEKIEVATRTDLVAIRATSDTSGEVSGNIFYVYGTIETNPAYTYYYELEDGGYKSTSVPAENTIIYYIDEETESPHILTYYLEDSDGCGRRSSDPIRYEIFVPVGSIVQSYEL